MTRTEVLDEAVRDLQAAGHEVKRVGQWVRWNGPNGLEIDMRHPQQLSTPADVDMVVEAMSEIIGAVRDGA